MFNSKEKKPVKTKAMERNVVAKNTTIVGDIKSDGDFRIDGTLEGTLKTQGRVIIGVDGFVKGNVEATNADIEGKFSGTLQVSKTLTIKGTANISGDVTIGKLSIEPGATFNATCAMKGALKEMNPSNESKKTSEKTA
ncbi:polymer-forming cytoskeletal protein [Polaribacter haliotis]|uniref:Polymer-forming cytoskeletal protein n=1 Tax=Polaribacter haliotis TaxID=1888915 RepID=A0A7L8ADA9_9FLAO|nr:polymer-forming cytoskeletal protein [Polaribacter haliotis]QOD59907.1 polymer-forming cytoskeletal protein [Polaribacter haliotis]